MCRSIKTLYNYDPVATDEEIDAAALQFVRKISGYRAPSSDNEAVFDAAVEEIGAASRRLLAGLRTKAKPRNREAEAVKAKARAAARYAPS